MRKFQQVSQTKDWTQANTMFLLMELGPTSEALAQEGVRKIRTLRAVMAILVDAERHRLTKPSA